MVEVPEFAKKFFDRIKAECLPRIDRATVAFYFVDYDVQRDRTGVLYKIAGHHFILTASHSLRWRVGSNIPLYIDFGDGKSLPVPLAEAKFHTTEPECRDVAVIELPPDVVTELARTKEFITHSDVRFTDERENSLYIFFGYPEDWSGVVSETAVLSIPLTYACRRFKGEPDADSHYDPKMHVILEFEQRALNTADGGLNRTSTGPER